MGSHAVGSAGLIITESLAVNREGLSTHYDAGLWSDAQIAGCQTCRAVLCCDSSPNQHTSKHAAHTTNPL